jgi:predicted RNase H-like HicB family nuclease
MRKFDLKATIWKEGRYYVSQCLNVDVASFGSTKKKAMDNLTEALELYFQDSDISKILKVGQADVVSLTLSNA